MIDIKTIRNDPSCVLSALRKRNSSLTLDAFLQTDKRRRELVFESEQLKNKQNQVTKQVPALKKAGEDTTILFDEMKKLSQNIKELDEQVTLLDEELRCFALTLPNIPHDSVPLGAGDEQNVEVRRFGTPRKVEFEIKPHWEIGEQLGILDAATAAKVTGTRFTFYKGAGATLERAIINFFLNTHIREGGYVEIFPPFMVHRNSMVGTGQLPKFEEDAFKVADTNYFLIPTAEVPVTNMYRDQILDAALLPIYHTAYSACFRAEAGSAGRDTRGLIRQHQFNKVELVKFTMPENSYDELEKLTLDAEKVLQMLGLTYRVVTLCSGDLGFSAAKTYDIEVWMPSYNRYVEISSCSNFEDFQARRANIKFKRSAADKAEFVHTLNGSGVAVGRTTAAILENYQQPDGSVIIPEVLVPYMGVPQIG